MPAERTRALEIDGLDQAALDTHAIVLGVGCDDPGPGTAPAQPATPAVLWEGAVQGDGTGPQASYYVRLYADGTAHCQCPRFYFRGVLRRDRGFACKHVDRARVARREPT
jgi:hypothetical protein